jgi:hypothetical protein
MFQAVVAIVMATVFGHVPFSDDANKPEFWCKNGTKIEKSDQTYYWVIDQKYEKVIVKAGSGEYANTIYIRPEPGLGAFADTNGNFTFDPEGRFGDKAISHLIVCPIEESTSSPSPTPSSTATSSSSPPPTSEPSPTPTVTKEPSPSPTDSQASTDVTGGSEGSRDELPQTGYSPLGTFAAGVIAILIGALLKLALRKE